MRSAADRPPERLCGRYARPSSSRRRSASRRRPARLIAAFCLARFGRIDALGQRRRPDRPRLLPRCRPRGLGVAVCRQCARAVLPDAGGHRRHAASAARAAPSSTSCRSTPIAARPNSPSIPPPRARWRLLTRNTANAHRFDRIRVNGINMGWTDTPAEKIMQAETLATVRAGSTRPRRPAVRPPARPSRDRQPRGVPA